MRDECTLVRKKEETRGARQKKQVTWPPATVADRGGALSPLPPALAHGRRQWTSVWMFKLPKEAVEQGVSLHVTAGKPSCSAPLPTRRRRQLESVGAATTPAVRPLGGKHAAACSRGAGARLWWRSWAHRVLRRGRRRRLQSLREAPCWGLGAGPGLKRPPAATFFERRSWARRPPPSNSTWAGAVPSGGRGRGDSGWWCSTAAVPSM